ncbi:hypothetical protein BCR42DRAFT_473864, partial [Absidia repens]
MNSDGSGTVLGLSDPPHVAETALFSFNPLVYLYFLLAFFIVPYPLYRFIASQLQWELNTKTVARHWNDCMLGCCCYGLNLFVFGNYSHGFSWITVLAFYPSLFAYGWIAERPFTKTSLPNIRHWSVGMWLVFLTALIIILAFAAFHIYVAFTLTFPFVVFYVCGLLIPITIMVAAKLLIKEVNTNWIRTTYHHWTDTVPPRQLPLSSSASSTSRSSSISTDQLSHNQPNKITIEVDPDEDINGMDYSLPLSPPRSALDIPLTLELEESQFEQTPYTTHLTLHLHHWQIFYVLAYFTRFTHPLSQVAAGIVLACYMEGVSALITLFISPIALEQRSRNGCSISAFIDVVDEHLNRGEEW